MTSAPSLGDWTEVSLWEQGWLQGRTASLDTQSRGCSASPRQDGLRTSNTSSFADQGYWEHVRGTGGP